MISTNPILRALAAAVCLFATVPAWSAEKLPSSPAVASPSAEASVAEARALMGKGRFDEALALLRPLVRGRVVEADTLFLFGFAALGGAEAPGVAEAKHEALLDEAIASFHAMLVRRPELMRVRLELGRAFFLKGEDGLAKRNFEQVLAGDPPDAVVLNVNRFLSRIRARRRWTMRLGMAIAPDSNIGASSDERIIYIAGLPFRRDQEELTQSGVGVSVWAGGEYQHPLDERWRLRAGADVSRREYGNSEFDRMSVSGHLGPRWLAGRATEASALAVVRQHWVANERDHRALGVRLEARHRLGRRATATARVSRHERRYEERTHLDGPVTDLSVGASWLATPTVRTNATLGWGRERPETERWRHTRRAARVGATVALPLGFTVGGSGTLRWTDYEGNWFPFVTTGEPRRDRTRSLRVNVHHRGFTLGGFSPQVSVVRETRTSNAQAHGYDRTFGELRFVRQF